MRGEAERQLAMTVVQPEQRIRADHPVRRIKALVDAELGPPLHTHRDQDDTFYVVDGVLSVQIGDGGHELEPGDFATAPPGVPHTFGNMRRGQALVRAINVMTAGGFDEFLREFSALPPGPPDAELLRRWHDKRGLPSSARHWRSSSVSPTDRE